MTPNSNAIPATVKDSALEMFGVVGDAHTCGNMLMDIFASAMESSRFGEWRAADVAGYAILVHGISDLLYHIERSDAELQDISL